LEENEPLLDVNQYSRANVSSKRIEKRTHLLISCDEFGFKEF
jgi:hypothetical protein